MQDKLTANSLQLRSGGRDFKPVATLVIRAGFPDQILGAGTRPKIGPDAFPSKVQAGFGESHAARIKHTVIRVEKTRGVVKAYLQVRAVIAPKQMASAHAMLRTRARVSAGSRASSHANTAANKRNTEKKSP